MEVRPTQKVTKKVTMYLCYGLILLGLFILRHLRRYNKAKHEIFNCYNAVLSYTPYVAYSQTIRRRERTSPEARLVLFKLFN